MKTIILTVIIGLWCLVMSFAAKHERPKRGASVYPVFGTGGGHGNGALTQSDTSGFLHYLGGQATSSSGHSGNRQSDSYGASSSPSHYSYTFVPVVAPSVTGHGTSGDSYRHRSSVFDDSILNAYTITTNHLNPPTTTSAPASSGWQLSGSSSSPHGYGGSFFTTHYGLLTPNFANYGSTGSTSSHPPTHRATLPTLTAGSLAEAARSSFYAQNNLFDTLLEGSNHYHPRNY